MKILLPCLALILAGPLHAQQPQPVWIDPELAAKENPDFLVQGEYFKEGASHAVQVVALGDGAFEGYVYAGGLPGAGWNPESDRISLASKVTPDGTVLVQKTGEFPMARLKQGTLQLLVAEGQELTLPRIERSSPTLGAKPPEGAVVLFDGSNVDGWKNAIMENGLLKANNSMSKERFKSYTAHIEFRTPYKPFARAQDRGNSGIYHQGRWETQVLDSFGRIPNSNETGGIYLISNPTINMCLPPLTWQTYDVDFTAATFDKEGNRLTWPRITVKLNGVVIQQDCELNKNCTRAAPIGGQLSDHPGPMFLQDHRNPVYFRNIWVLPK